MAEAKPVHGRTLFGGFREDNPGAEAELAKRNRY